MRNTVRILLSCLLIFATVFCIASCEKAPTGENVPTGENSPTEAVSEAEICTVSFENTDLENQSLKKGDSLQRPNDPAKSDCVFVDWYTDADYINKAIFPITVDSDIKLYARFFTYQEAFQNARENTVGDAVPGFEYTYSMDISASYVDISLAGKTTGNAKYSTIGEVNFYDESVNSGVLLLDGSNYKIRRGTSLQNVSLDENGTIKSFSVEQVDYDYKYDSSSLAKAVFTYSNDQLISISPTDKKDVYKLDTSISVSSVVSLIANCINHPIVEKLLCELPETSADTNLYVSFTGDKIESYTYEFKVDVSDLQFNLTYTLMFTNIGTAKEIVPKNFENVHLSSNDIQNVKNEASAIVNAFKDKESSGYDFKVDTGVDFGMTSGEINATFKGSAYRKRQNNAVFFHNDIEIDSDYKNKDLYKDKGIEDVRVILTKLSNGEVYVIEKKFLNGDEKQLGDFVDSDLTSFYLLDIVAQCGDFSFAEKVSENNKTVYTFGLTNNGTATLLTWLNTSLDLDPLAKASVEALVYGQFIDSSMLINTGTVVVSVIDGELEGIAVKVEGDFITSFEESVDFTNANKAQIKLDISVSVNEDGNTFEPFDSVKDAK